MSTGGGIDWALVVREVGNLLSHVVSLFRGSEKRDHEAVVRAATRAAVCLARIREECSRR